MKDKMNWRKFCILLIVPLASGVIAIFIRGMTTPYFIFNHDPEYAYLFNGLSILNFLSPSHIDHPGTPLQILSAIVIKLTHPFDSLTKITSALITDPERYLLYINNVLLSLNVAMLVTAGIIVHHVTNKMWLSLLMQSTALLFVTALISLTRVTPEPFLLAVSILFSCLLLLFLNYIGEEEKQLRLAKYIGLISGLGVALKLTFVPVVILPLFIMHTNKLFKRYIKYVLIGFVISTLPLLLKFPLFSQYRKIIKWAYNLFLGSGIYGGGSHTIFNADKFFGDLLRFFLSEPVYSFVIVLSVVTFLFGIKKIRHWSDFKNNYTFRLLGGFIFIHIIMLVMVAKHPQSERYLVPAFGLAGATMVIVCLFVKEQIRLNFSNVTKEIFLGCIGTCLIAFVVYSIWNITVSFDHEGDKKRRELLVRENIVKINYSDCAYVHQDSLTKPFALFFGLGWSRRSEAAKKLGKDFFNEQKVFTYDPGVKMYLHYSMEGIKVISLEDIKKTATCVIKIGPGAELKVL